MVLFLKSSSLASAIAKGQKVLQMLITSGCSRFTFILGTSDQFHLLTHPKVGSIIDISTHGYADHSLVSSASDQVVSLMEGLQVQENSGQAAPSLQPLFASGSNGASASFSTLSAAFAQMQMSSEGIDHKVV